MTRIHNNLKIEICGDFVNISALLIYVPAGHALHRLWPRVEGEPFQRPELGFFRVDVCGCNGHVPRGTRETPALHSRMRPFSMPSLKRGGSMWKLHASVVI